MPEMTGVEFFEKIKKTYPDPMRILLTGYSDIQTVIDSINKGQVYRYITKPWNEDELKVIISSCYEVFCLRKENKELMKSLLQANKQLEFMLRQKLLS
jgi:response regulator RpfG family c-di-GMP phosphodiesterase